MANRKEVQTLLVVGVLTLSVAGAGLYLGFQSPRGPKPRPAIPTTPDEGPFVYGLRSIRSDPDRVRFEWNEVPGAGGYEVTLMTATDESLFVSPTVRTTAWTMPSEYRARLDPQTVYHWRLTVRLAEGGSQVSDPASFATQ